MKTVRVCDLERTWGHTIALEEPSMTYPEPGYNPTPSIPIPVPVNPNYVRVVKKIPEEDNQSVSRKRKHNKPRTPDFGRIEGLFKFAGVPGQ